MAMKPKKGLRSSIDEVLGNLLGDDDDISHKASTPASYGATGGRARGLTTHTNKKSLLEDDFFDKTSLEEGEEISDISDVDPQALLGTKGIEDMEADLLGIKKPNSGTAEKPAKNVIKTQLSSESAKPLQKTSPAKKVMDDPLAGHLHDGKEGIIKKAPSSPNKNTSETKAEASKEKGTSITVSPASAVNPEQKQELMFEDEEDDLMDVLGLDENPKAEQNSCKKSEEEERHPARSTLDELLGQGTAKKQLEWPSTEDDLGGELTFGAYQPTVASATEGRRPRRPSVRFSSENQTKLKTDQRSKPSTPSFSSPVRAKTGADWLGLKEDDFDSPPSSPPKESSIKGAMAEVSHGASGDKLHDPASLFPSIPKPVPEAAAKPEPSKDEDSDNWLSNVISQKKTRIQEKVKEERPGPSNAEEVDPVTLNSTPKPWLKSQEKTPASPSDSRKGETAATTFLHGQQDIVRIPAPSQLLPAETHLVSSPNTVGYEKRLSEMQMQLRESLANYQTELLIAQARITELEGQARRLELEKNQQALLLESLQQRHQEDLEIIEQAHRNRVKVIEESYRQREERIRQENQELAEQYLSRCQSVEQTKSEMLAQHQRTLTELERQKVKEVDQLQELQRISIQEMRKEHEDQLKRLKQLKAQEIDAVTSATSYTRSFNGVIEQMEKFSSNLNDLANKVEATHHTTHQGLEIGARQRDEQLRVLQDRLALQQRDMEDERTRLQEVISKMEARLSEQARLLEQERWRVKAEQSKAESLQHSLEEQRRVMTQQLAMEREELERAKNSLLEEQNSVMQKCAEERRKVAAEWSELHAQERLVKERAEREVDRALQIDSHREGAIMNIAKEQADLKIKASELRSKEEQLVREREILEQEKQELRLEKEKVSSAALRIKEKTMEINRMSKLSSQKYEEGEKALLEARRMESEHQARLRLVQRQMDQLKQQEERLYQEQLSLNQQRRQLEELRIGLPTSPLAFQSFPPVPLPGALANGTANMHYLSSTLNDLPKAKPCNNAASPDHPRLGPAELYAERVLHKLTAAQDHDFLEEEQFFLETLKKASYNTPSQSA